MVREVVYLYNLANFRHLRVDDNNLIIGETVYNAQVKRNPVIQYNRAPSALLAHYPHWFTLEDVARSLQQLGFTQKNEVEWEK